MALAIALLSASAEAQVQPGPADFTAYTDCRLAEGPAVVETAPLAEGVTERTIKTITGSHNVPMVAGRRVMFAFPNENFYANVKVEILPQAGYADAKAALIGNFEYLLASGDNSRNYALRPKLNGFEIQGLDREKREGGVLGIYLWFDDPTRTVTTAYLLNQEPPKRFKTMEEYAKVRDKFLNAYTACIREHLKSNGPLTR